MDLACVWKAYIYVRNLCGDTGPAIITGVGICAKKFRRIAVGKCQKVRNSSFTGLKRLLFLIASAMVSQIDAGNSMRSLFPCGSVYLFYEI